MPMLAWFVVSALLAASANARGDQELRAWGSQVLSADMQPGVVAKLLARVEGEWTTKTISSLRGERDNATTVAEIQQSCSKIASSIVQGSGGNKDNVMEYMSDVCSRSEDKSVDERRCQSFATALKRLMSDDESTNRNDLDFPGFCVSYYKANVVVDASAEKERADKEAAEKKAAEEKAAKEAAEKKAAAEKAAKEAAEKKAAEEKKAKEAAEKKAAEEKAAKEAAEKKAAEEKAEQEVREAEEKAQMAAELAAAKRKAIAERKDAVPAALTKEPLAKVAATPAKLENGGKKQLTLASVRSPKNGPKGLKRTHEKQDNTKKIKLAEAPTKRLKQGKA